MNVYEKKEILLRFKKTGHAARTIQTKEGWNKKYARQF